jgi:hypothetical protein
LLDHEYLLTLLKVASDAAAIMTAMAKVQCLGRVLDQVDYMCCWLMLASCVISECDSQGLSLSRHYFEFDINICIIHITENNSNPSPFILALFCTSKDAIRMHSSLVARVNVRDPLVYTGINGASTAKGFPPPYSVICLERKPSPVLVSRESQKRHCLALFTTSLFLPYVVL